MPPTPVFSTPRLDALPWSLEHVDEAHELYGDPEVGRFIGGHQASRAETRALVERILERLARIPAGLGSFPLHLRDEPGAPMVGAALIKPLPGADGTPTDDVEVGWHVHRARWGNGFATEAGHGLLAHGFETLDLEVLHAVVHEGNAASHAVARHIGLERVGITHAYYEGMEAVHYVLERERWRARRRDG